MLTYRPAAGHPPGPDVRHAPVLTQGAPVLLKAGRVRAFNVAVQSQASMVADSRRHLRSEMGPAQILDRAGAGARRLDVVVHRRPRRDLAEGRHQHQFLDHDVRLADSGSSDAGHCRRRMGADAPLAAEFKLREHSADDRTRDRLGTRVHRLLGPEQRRLCEPLLPQRARRRAPRHTRALHEVLGPDLPCRDRLARLLQDRGPRQCHGPRPGREEGLPRHVEHRQPEE